MEIDFSSYYKRFFLLQKATNRLLILSIFFSCCLSAARVIYTGSLAFVFLIWNLFLAFIPYFITELLEKNITRLNQRLFFLVFLIWLLFIPNSFYIITDLFHLNGQSSDHLVPTWFDLALIFSFAWNGLLLGMISVRQMEKICFAGLCRNSELLFVYPVMWLNSFGIYIGRYLRFNSWDIVTNPIQLSYDIGRMLVHPIWYRFAWSMIMCFSMLMTLMYLTLKRMSHGKFELNIPAMK